MMIECRVRFNYPPHLLDQPIIYDFGKKFDVVTRVLDANVTPQQGQLLLSIQGEEEVVEQGLAWVSEQGVIVERWAGLDGQSLLSPC
jgi:ABC-type methionine transport system ATPase subunit